MTKREHFEMNKYNAWEWFAIYLGCGLAAYLLLRVLVKLTGKERKPTKSAQALLDAAKPPKTPLQRIREKTKNLLEYALALLFWPLPAGIAIHELVFVRSVPWEPNPEDAFTCKKKHLVRQTTPEEAQKLGVVVDPLHRVPDLPFGHLNAGWLALLNKQAAGHQLWFFEIAEQDRIQTRGFALVKKGAVCEEFLYEWN
jgi:hypothetical protein